MAESIISAKRFGTRTDAIRQTTWEMLSRNVREAYLWQVVLGKGGRYGVTAPGTRINEYAESIVKSVITCYSQCYSGRWYLGIRVAKSPVSW